MVNARARSAWRILGFGFLLFTVGLVWIAKDHLLPETAPGVRGAAQARELGCWECHGDATRAPSLFAGDPVPARIAARIREAPQHTVEIGAAALDDLVAWIRLVQHEGARTARETGATPEWRAVELLASRQCFGCHGELGQGGVSNPGSLKGYVPGFFGRDFDVLTRDGDPKVLRQWIRDGVPRFFTVGLGQLRPALWFMERQQVKMPGYARSLSAEQIDALVSYLTLLRELGPLDAEGIARHRARLAQGSPGG